MAVNYRILLATDPYCPACGHNRDKSSVSTIDRGLGYKECQMCAAQWLEVNADTPEHKPSTRRGLDLPPEPV